MNHSPDYMIHEDRYRYRRDRQDIYSGWFTERDYESGMSEIEDFFAMGFSPETGRLLDVGCGAGNYSFRLAERGYDVTGIDISATAINWARENCEERKVSVNFICGDGIRLPEIENCQFDFVFDGHFFHCVVGGDREIFLNNIHRVLRPDGFFMVRSLVWPVTLGEDLDIDPSTKTGYLQGRPYRYYPNAEDLISELQKARFIVHDWRYTVTTDDGYGFQHVVVQCTRT